MRVILLAVRFLSEIATLVALAAWGWLWAESWLRFVLAVAAPVVVAALWGRFIAPASDHRLPDPARLALEIVIFAATAVCLVLLDAVTLALGYAAVAVGVALVLRLTPEHPAGEFDGG